MSATAQLHRLFCSAPTPKRAVAVVLNANARRVGSRVEAVRALLGKDDTLFVSHSVEQSKFIARSIVQRGDNVVLCGGGDGTFTQLVSDVRALRPHRLPAFGVLRLGTGNALAEALGASSSTRQGLLNDLEQARTEQSRVALPLLTIEGRVAPFAGIGLDSLILQDYNAVKTRLQRFSPRVVHEGQVGYGLAIATRSIWRYMLEARPTVTIRNQGRPAQHIDHTGNQVGDTIDRDAIIYQGPVCLAAVSTVPFFGFGVRAFPQACLAPNCFQLRIANLSLGEVLPKLPKLVSGEFRHRRLWDFRCSAVSIEIDPPTPVQIGGDVIGYRDRIEVGVTSVPAVIGARGLAVAPAPQPLQNGLRLAC